MSDNYINKQQGFTLVEIAIVMVIFGLIIGGIMGPLKVQLENIDRKETQNLIATTQEAMMGFAIRYGRLPCPDTSGDGQENEPCINYDEAKAKVPWATLGISSQDAWNQPLTYQVDTRFAKDVPGGVSFGLSSTGNITVRVSSAGATTEVKNIPAIIISHGKNWAATGDVNEKENKDGDVNFVDKNHVNQGYDDFVGWVNLNKLIATMVSVKKLP